MVLCYSREMKVTKLKAETMDKDNIETKYKTMT